MTILDDLRAAWNARPPTRSLTAVPWRDRVGVSWHWIGPGKGPSGAGPHSACLEQMRDWQAQHQAKGWKDIGYNATICQHARAIEGRGLAVEGSHSPGVNYVHVGVQFMVGADGSSPTPAMYARAARLRSELGALGPNIGRDWSHKDDLEASTTCPGATIHQWVHSGGPEEEQGMALTDDDIRRIWAYGVPRPGNTASPAGSQLGNANVLSYRALNVVEELRDRPAVDAAAVAAAIAPAVAEAVTAAVAAALAAAPPTLGTVELTGALSATLAPVAAPEGEVTPG